MENYEQARIILTNTQLNKLNSSVKNNTGATLKVTKNFHDEELSHKLF